MLMMELMTNPNLTEIIFVVDQSGSMYSIASDMEGGFSTFIEEQKKSPGECRVSLFQFSDNVQKVYLSKPLEESPNLKIRPQGATALWDGLGTAISYMGSHYSSIKEEERPSKVIVVTITDGKNNCSKEFGEDKLKKMISHQKEKYSWDFVFLGADLEASKTASSLGIQHGVAYRASGDGSRAVFESLSKSVTTTRTTRGSLSYSQKDYDEKAK